MCQVYLLKSCRIIQIGILTNIRFSCIGKKYEKYEKLEDTIIGLPILHEITKFTLRNR
jgi:hypothetical protein